MIGDRSDTVKTLAAKSGQSGATVRRLIRSLEREHNEKILVVKPGCTTNLEVDMAAFHRCLLKSRRKREQPEPAKRKRRRRWEPLPGQLALF